MIDFTLSPEQELIKETAKDFANTHLLPGVIERDEDQKFPKDEIKKIEGNLLSTFDAKIKLNFKKDPSLIGGLIIQVNSTMIDTSIRSKLQKIENKMLEE